MPHVSVAFLYHRTCLLLDRDIELNGVVRYMDTLHMEHLYLYMPHVSVAVLYNSICVSLDESRYRDI